MAEGPPGILLGMHVALLGQAAAFTHIAAAAGRDDIFPNRAPTFGARNNVIECQIRRWFAMTAILAGKTIAQENIKTREGGIARCGDIFLQRDNAWQFHLETWRMHRAVIFRQNIHTA